MKRTPWLGQNQAFSLTELLVGVVIGGLLVGLAAPAVQGALDKSKQSKDLSNLRQIGQGITLFSGENDGRLPPSSCKAETQEELELSWIYSLRDYLGQNYDHLRLSPSDPYRETRRKFKNTSYLINEEVDGNGSLSRAQRIDRPSQRMLLFWPPTPKTPADRRTTFTRPIWEIGSDCWGKSNRTPIADEGRIAQLDLPLISLPTATPK